MPLLSHIKIETRVRACVRVCKCVSARATASVSSSKRNDNESTDTSKGPWKKEGAHKKGEKNAKLKYSEPSEEEKIKQAWFSSTSPEKETERKETERK